MSAVVAEKTSDKKKRLTLNLLRGTDFARRAGPISAGSIRTVQINIGLKCNLACHHCHVESSPNRNEAMTWETLEHVLRVAKETGAQTVDITGGAPEMHPHFRQFVDAALTQGLRVMVRTNLTIMQVEGYTDLVDWYAARDIYLVASLPCYLETNVDKQRGRGVYHDSIEIIRKLNAVGYGTVDGDGVGKPLDLVYNPGGASLPPRQEDLEPDYKRELLAKWGIQFSRLICITNMPLGRFMHDLARDGKDEQYMAKLKDAYNPGTIEGLMCRHQIHVGHDGTLYDCDFNYAVNLPAARRPNIADVDADAWLSRKIVVADHCFACTAGAGSSCGGELA